MSNRDQLIDGLHSVLAELWEGSDEMAAAEFRKLMTWSARAVKPTTPTYRAGTFPAPVRQDAQDLLLLESAATGMRLIEASFNSSSKDTAQLVKDLLSVLSERQLA
jgi:hypothetical protein